MDTFAALAILRCKPVAGDLALSALPDAPVLPDRQPSTLGVRGLIRRLDLPVRHRRHRGSLRTPTSSLRSTS
jgi:hypothetical protein